jgi:superfamily II DNA or RNA helicase
MIVLKPYQQTATAAATDILVGGRPDGYGSGRTAVAPDRRAVLIEAPTGSGKTVMAGTVVSLCGKTQKVLWMWFAPFAGVTGQSAEVLAAQFGDLRVRSLQHDRDIEAVRPNDIYVTTWGAVAARNADSRVVRTQSESLASIDQVVADARARGFLIGVVVDEAHHGFVKAAQAKKFFTKTLMPDITILVTATPNDRDIEVFRLEADLGSVARVSVSRADAVAAGLIKPGIRAVSFTRAPNSGATPIDFERTALRYGVDTHNAIKRGLGQNQFDVTPLMLVQVESGEESVARARQTLMDFGIPESAIATHTSDEPDPDILALAHDEQVQVLIFKMAVALGFDAPRAWTLVSMRSSKDVDFGVQIVGRVLRVDRRLQGRPIPESLQYGYVFVADPDVQAGLLSAAEQINRLRTDIQRVTSQTTMVMVQVGPEDTVPTRVTPEGAPTMSAGSAAPIGGSGQSPAPAVPGVQPWQTVRVPVFGEVDLFGMQAAVPEVSGDASSPASQIVALVELAGHKYPLRVDLAVPAYLQQERFPRDDTRLAGCVGDRIRFDADALHALQREGVFVVRREVDLFAAGAKPTEPTRVAGEMDLRQIIKQGQTALFEDDYVGGHSLLPELVKRFAAECEREGMLGWLKDKETLEQGVFRVLGNSPHLLRRALRECLADYIELQDAAPLPTVLESPEPLAPSRHNVYGVVPPGLNTWEADFAEMLDLDTTGTVLWWHRNPPRKDWSVRVCAPGTQHDYYPDFVVGVNGRAKSHGILLVETKYAFNTKDSMAKVRADHKAYGRVLMLTREDGDWWTLQYDLSRDKVVQDQRLLLSMLARF